jgi:hypothetical protein
MNENTGRIRKAERKKKQTKKKARDKSHKNIKLLLPKKVNISLIEMRVASSLARAG